MGICAARIRAGERVIAHEVRRMTNGRPLLIEEAIEALGVLAAELIENDPMPKQQLAARQ